MPVSAAVTLSEDEFYAYSLAFYFHGSNKNSLLYLQDEAGVNVNIVLLVMYLWRKSVTLSAEDIKQVNADNEYLDSLSSNIRCQRRSLKATKIAQGIHDYKTMQYKDLLAQELKFEKQQQAQMLKQVTPLLDKAVRNTSYKQDLVKSLLMSLINENSKMNLPEIDSAIDSLLHAHSEVANEVSF